ncbi:hypothetical protein FDECE_4568 [Fusarium decemcellulare]|nr:hypothetical protein FDECE_4568 [Fusarium decemcellulare]
MASNGLFQQPRSVSSTYFLTDEASNSTNRTARTSSYRCLNTHIYTDMADEFRAKVAVVTGAGGGIGSKVALMLASRGASVALMDIADCAGQAANIQGQFQVRAISIQVDMTDNASVEAAFSRLSAWSDRLDLCVNAAGIFPMGRNIGETDPAQWRKVFAVNVDGVFFCMRQELQAFLRLGIRGSIVNISSDAGSVASVGCSAYVASKHAINGLTKTAALEYASQGHRINAVAPGNIDTPMIQGFGATVDEIGRASQPVGRCGRPEEVAELICFLLSERSAFMTGSIVAIDGGITTAGYGAASSNDLYTTQEPLASRSCYFG